MIHGLFNIGNSCYLNSTLQCLLNNDEFVYYIKTILEVLRGKSAENLDRFNLLNLIIDLLEIKNPVNLKQLLSGYNELFRNNRQQDSHESLLIILDIIHEKTKNVNLGLPMPISFDSKDNLMKQSIDDWKKYIKVFGYSFVTYLYSGQFISSIYCSNCNHTNNSFEIFNDICLNVIDKNSLKEMFINFFNGEIINDVECTKCKIRCSHSKKLSIWKFPRHLIISLKRFLNNGHKDNSEIEISEQINFNGNITINYRLSFIVCHEGSSIGSGHYTTVVIEKNMGSSRWYHIDDEVVREINKFKFSKTAYFLIYSII
jgi:ubiquitin C-terminal hydrolase